MARILGSNQINRLQHRERTLRNIAKIADRRRDNIELALRILGGIVLFHCLVRIADLILNID